MNKALLLLVFGFLSFGCLASVRDTYQSPTAIRPSGSEDFPLDNASVTAIFKDNLGFMWFWSDVGLLCYDGSTCRPFPAPEFGLDIARMEETPEGLFLLFAPNGRRLLCFDRRNERYLEVVCSDSLQSLTYSRASGLVGIDKHGLVRFGYRIDRSGDTPYLQLMPSRLLAFDQPLRLATADSRGRIWAVVDGKNDVVCFDLWTGRAEYFSMGLAAHIYRMFVFDNEFWCTFNWSGMLYCNTNTRKKVLFDADRKDQSSKQINYTEVHDVAQAEPGCFYMVSWSGALHINFNHRPYSITRSPYFTDIWGQAIEQRALSIYCDQENETLWIGTFAGGVVRYSNDLNFTIPLPGKSVYHLTQDKRGYVWLSTTQSGIMRSTSTAIDEQTAFAPWGKEVFSPNRHLLYNDGRRSLWFADNRGTIVQVDQYTERHRTIFLTTDGKNRLTDGIVSICLDSKGRLWVASYTHLYYWDTNSRSTEPIFTQLNPVGLPPDIPLMHVIEDREGVMWIGTQRGLYRLDEENGTYRAKGGYEVLSGSTPSTVYALTINSRGDIVASYGDRLTRIDNSDKDQVGLELRTADGTLPSSHVVSLIDDRYGNTWLGTNTRIMVVKSGGNYVSTYSLSNGNRNVCRLEDGRLLWVSSDGLTYFHPNEIRDEWTGYRVELSRLKVNGTDIYAGVPYGGETILRHGLPYTDTLVLSEQHSNFELYFSDLSYTPFEKRVLYKLEPTTNDWQPHIVGHELSFPPLSPGVYRLLIKPIYANETEGQVKQLTVVIRPLWYRSVGFFVLTFLGACAVLWFVFLWAQKQLRHFRRRQIHRLYEAIQSKDETLAAVPTPSSGKILVVGTNPETTERLGALFADDGFELFFSHNSADALIDLFYHLPRIVLCSMDMPGAMEFCRKAKDNVRSSTIPLVVVDGTEDPGRRMEALEARADDYLALGTDFSGGALLRQVVDNRMSGREAVNLLVQRMLDEQHQASTAEPDNSPSAVLLRRVETLTLEHAKDPTFGVRRLAELMNVSQSTLYRRVLKASDGRTVIEVMRDARLRRASELLAQGELTVSGVAEEVGYQDVATFRKHFVDLFGLNPSDFMKLQGSGNDTV